MKGPIISNDSPKDDSPKFGSVQSVSSELKEKKPDKNKNRQKD